MKVKIISEECKFKILLFVCHDFFRDNNLSRYFGAFSCRVACQFNYIETNI